MLTVDSALEDLINEWSGHFAPFDIIMKFAAADLIYLVVPLGLALWLVPGASADRALRQRLWMASVTGAVLALILAAFVAHFHTSIRPFVVRGDTNLLISHAPDNGFPSDHATVVFAFSGTFICWRRPLGVAALVAASLIAFARVFVGVHWPSDVLAGAAIGLVVGLCAAQTVPWWKPLQARAAAFLPGWAVSAP